MSLTFPFLLNYNCSLPKDTRQLYRTTWADCISRPVNKGTRPGQNSNDLCKFFSRSIPSLYFVKVMLMCARTRGWQSPYVYSTLTDHESRNCLQAREEREMDRPFPKCTTHDDYGGKHEGNDLRRKVYRRSETGFTVWESHREGL